MSKSAADDILMRRDAEDLRERAQEVERANPGTLRGIVEIDFLVVVRFDPRGGIDCTSAVDRRTHSNVGGFTRQGLADARRALLPHAERD